MLRRKDKSFKVKCSSTCVIVGTLTTAVVLGGCLGSSLFAASKVSQLFNSTANDLLQKITELSIQVPALSFNLPNLDFPIPETTVPINLTPDQIRPLLADLLNTIQSLALQNSSLPYTFNTSVAVPASTIPVQIPQEQVYSLLEQFSANALGLTIPQSDFDNINQTLTTNITTPGFNLDSAIQVPQGLIGTLIQQLFSNSSVIIDSFNQTVSINFTTPAGLSVPINGTTIPVDLGDTFTLGSFIDNSTISNIKNGINTGSDVLYYIVLGLGLILTFILVDAVIDKFLIFGRKAHRDNEIKISNPDNDSRELSNFAESKSAEQGNDVVHANMP